MRLCLIYPRVPFWRAEVIRLALHLGEIPFEEFFPKRSEYVALRASGRLPFGQVPVLEIDGQPLTQTSAIARFCGKLSGHYPADDIAAARVDELIDVATDITFRISPSIRESDPEIKRALRRELAETTLPKWFDDLEKYIARVQVGERGYLVADQLTIADFAIWRMIGWISEGVLDGIPTDILTPFPLLEAHYEMMKSTPEIEAWMARYKK
jgi:prostaglandin-H2 D-isomerase / glutathione transferase